MKGVGTDMQGKAMPSEIAAGKVINVVDDVHIIHANGTQVTATEPLLSEAVGAG